jgi:hypothetical protein
MEQLILSFFFLAVSQSLMVRLSSILPYSTETEQNMGPIQFGTEWLVNLCR